MFFLNLIPDSLLHLVVTIILFSGIVLYILGLFINFFPNLYLYREPIRIISTLLIIAGIYGYGSYTNEMNWRLKLAEVQVRIDKAEAASTDANNKLAAALAISKQVITKQQIVVRDRIVEVKQIVNAECKISPTVIDILNEAAKRPVEATQ